MHRTRSLALLLLALSALLLPTRAMAGDDRGIFERLHDYWDQQRGTWVLDNNSSYDFLHKSMDGQLLPRGTTENLEAAARLLEQAGVDTRRLAIINILGD